MNPKIITALMSTPAEGEEQFIKSLGDMSEEKLGAAVASYRIQKGMKDLIDNETMANVTKSAGYAVAVKTEETPKDKTKKSIDLSSVDPETKAQIEAIYKSHDEMAKKADQLHNIVKMMQEEQQEREFVAKAAKEYSHLPLDEKSLGSMLKTAHNNGKEFAEGFEKLLGRMDEIVSKSQMFGSIGHTAPQTSGGGWEKMQEVAKSSEKSVSEVLKSKSGEELYMEYLQDNPAQRA